MSRNLIWLGVATALVLLIAVACGDDATSTPAPTNTPVATSVPTNTPVATSTPLPTATPEPTDTPVPPGPVVNRLEVAIQTPNESNDPVIADDALPQLYPMYDAMVRLNERAGFDQMLAESWDVSPDAKTWSFNLRKGVQFHKGYGEVTAADVEHTTVRASRDEGVATWVEFLRSNVIDRTTIENDYRITFNLPAPAINVDYIFSTAQQHMILSKDHFDAEGPDGVQNNPIGTGPYQMKEQVIGTHKLYERVPYEHYRITPDFQEIKISFVAEPSTRLAQLLAGEVHMTQLPPDLENTAVDGGKKIIFSSTPYLNLSLYLGGLFLPTAPAGPRIGDSPDLPYSDVYHDVLELPWAHKKVRQALNMAINRQEIKDTLLGGNGELMMLFNFHPTLRGWNPEWETRFEAEYGYNPDKARQLLKEVEEEIGQSLDWSKVRNAVFSKPELPQLGDVAEAIGNYWKAVGADIKIDQWEWDSFIAHFYAVTHGGIAITNVVQRFDDPLGLQIFYYSGGPCCHLYENAEVDKIYEELVPVTDLARRDELVRQAGNIIFDDFGGVPLFWLFGTVAVDPRVVDDYQTTMVWGLRDLEYVKAVKE